MKSSEVDVFFKGLKVLLFLFLASSLLLLSYPSLKILAFLVGAFLGLLNFYTLKEDGKILSAKVYQNVMACHEKPYQKERTLFLIKIYLRLLALGIIFYFLIDKIKLHPLYLLFGFSLSYGLIFLLVFLKLKQRGEEIKEIA